MTPDLLVLFRKTLPISEKGKIDRLPCWSRLLEIRPSVDCKKLTSMRCIMEPGDLSKR